MDNRLLNINGSGEELLLKAIEIACLQKGYEQTIDTYKIHPKKGLILLFYSEDKSRKLPGPMTAKEILPIVQAYLRSDAAKEVELGDFEDDKDHDGHNTVGWRVYTDDWGHVGGEHATICAIKRVCLWMGK